MKPAKINIPITLCIVLGLALSLSIIINNPSCRKVNQGDINQGPGSTNLVQNSEFYGPVYLGGKEYFPNLRAPIEDIKFSPKIKVVAVKNLSLDEVIDLTPVCKNADEGGCAVLENENNMNIYNVMQHIAEIGYRGDIHWNSRAKALRLLSKVTNKILLGQKNQKTEEEKKNEWRGILKKAIDSIKVDESPAVRREALKAFDELTDFNRKDDFDFNGALKWEKTGNHREEAIKKLKEERN